MHPIIRVISYLAVAAGLALGGRGSLFVGIAILTLALLATCSRDLLAACRGVWALRWLWCSVFSVYLAFTPGNRILPGWAVPSFEGVNEGLERVASLALIVVYVGWLVRATGREELGAVSTRSPAGRHLPADRRALGGAYDPLPGGGPARASDPGTVVGRAASRRARRGAGPRLASDSGGPGRGGGHPRHRPDRGEWCAAAPAVAVPSRTRDPVHVRPDVPVRVALGLEYDGSGFRGWQIERGARSVQSCVEAALSRVADHGVRVVCAGRTDTGVHALSQVIHFDTEGMRDERAWVFGGNTYLPSDVSILWARRVPDDFHARYSATARVYRYVIRNRPARPGSASRVTWEYRPLCETLMREAACYLLGEHDFSAFRAQGCQAGHAVRTIHRLEVDREEDCVSIEIEANAFLYHMVRNIAGVLMAIGRGVAAPVWAQQVLEAGRRAQGGVTAPASGLYLMAVRYPPARGIPEPRAEVPGFSR